jgi:uncharacterized protein YegP (UPF0339 family)
MAEERKERLELRAAKTMPPQHYVVKVGKNGEDLWTSELYTTKVAARDAALRELKSNPQLDLVDVAGGEELPPT